MPSQALAGLTVRLRDVEQLMAAHTAVGGLEPGRRFDVEGLNRASVVMLCAHFEGYLEELLTEALQAVQPALDASVVTRPFHNPWPDRIDELFAFLGMQQPSREVSWQKAGNLAVRTNLNDLVRTRNQIAHGTTGVAVRRTDVTRYGRYVAGFALRFDRLVRARVRAITGVAPWPA